MLTFAARGYAPTTPLTKADCSMDFEDCQERTEQEDIQRRHALAPLHIYHLLHGTLLPLWGRSHSMRSAGVHKRPVTWLYAKYRRAKYPRCARPHVKKKSAIPPEHYYYTYDEEKGLLMNIPLLAFHLTVYKIHYLNLFLSNQAICFWLQEGSLTK